MASKHDLDRLRFLRSQLDSALGEVLIAGQGEQPAGDTPGAWIPSVDILESESEFWVTAELPGVLRGDIELRAEDSELELAGTRRAPSEGGSFQCMEGRYGPFRRVLALGQGVDGHGIKASLEDGVLSIRIPKRTPGLGRRKIDVDWEGDDG